MTSEIMEVCHQLRMGDLTMVYARYDEKTGLFYCTLRPRKSVVADLPSIPNALSLALETNNDIREVERTGLEQLREIARIVGYSAAVSHT